MPGPVAVPLCEVPAVLFLPGSFPAPFPKACFGAPVLELPGLLFSARGLSFASSDFVEALGMFLVLVILLPKASLSVFTVCFFFETAPPAPVTGAGTALIDATSPLVFVVPDL